MFKYYTFAMAKIGPIIGASAGLVYGAVFSEGMHQKDMHGLSSEIAAVTECQAGRVLPELGDDLVMYCSGVELVEVAEDSNNDGSSERVIDYEETLENLQQNRNMQPVKSLLAGTVITAVIAGFGLFAGGAIDGSIRPPRRPKLEPQDNKIEA
jgi:hypothetical protein